MLEKGLIPKLEQEKHKMSLNILFCQIIGKLSKHDGDMSKGYRSQPYESPIGQIWDNLTTGTTMMVREYNTQIHARITELMGEKIIFILREKDNKCKKKGGNSF